MSKVAIVTDSTAYIPEDLRASLNITVIPLAVIWGQETFVDGVTITPSQFYTRLQTAKVMPTTSQATIHDMNTTFNRLVAEGYEVMGIFLSSKLSGTMQSALQAREEMGAAGQKITLFDSQGTSMMLGFQALSVARAAAQGASRSECLALAEQNQPKTGLYFVVDTLEFLHRGGRIGGAQRFLGTALNLKPILSVQDGKVAPAERVRTMSKALDRVIDIVAEKCAGKTNIRLSTLHANAAENAKDVLTRASARLGAVESISSEVSPVVGTHTGPGTVGLAYMFD